MLVNETLLVVSTTDHTTWAVSVKTINQQPPNLHFRFFVSLKRVNLTIHVHVLFSATTNTGWYWSYFVPMSRIEKRM